MSRIAIIHPRFDTKGGAEVVCLNTIEALQKDHDLRLFSFDEPDFDALNDFCGTDVSSIPTWHPERIGLAFDGVASALTRINGSFGNLNKLRTALLNPLVRRRIGDFDLRVSTGGEMALPEPSLQYIHLPIFNGRVDSEYGTNGFLSITHDWFCSTLAGIDRDTMQEATILANSEWTAEVFESRYGIRPAVLHPPVTLDEFYDTPWADREDGFVALGRISPDKNILEIVEIIELVRNRGHDVHLHVVGPTAPHCSEYRNRVERVAKNREWVHLEGQLSREELVDLVCTHKYGIHGKRAEHFGIAVAELVVGGTIPFVPSDGGQIELVGKQTDLMYGSAETAVDKIDAVLTDTQRANELRANLPDMESLGQARFQRRISAYVNEIA